MLPGMLSGTSQAILLAMLLGFVAPAQAGIFADNEAREQIQQLEARISSLEEAGRQQIKSLLDLQSQIEALNSEIRKLRGQHEETAHGLQDAEKRQKDFYVDLDTRVRNFESAVETAAATKEAPSLAPPAAATPPSDPSDPALENRAFEAAYDLFKAGNHANAVKAFQEFISGYPESVHLPNAHYWLAKSQFALKDYKAALATYQTLLNDFPNTPKAADALLGIAGCQRGLKQPVASRKTLKQLIAKYPDSVAATKAKKLLEPK